MYHDEEMLLWFNFCYEFVGPDDAETFEMELSGFLREFGV